MGQLKDAAEELQRGRGAVEGLGGVLLLLTPPQREIFAKTQAMMSLLEGHASYVMNEVGEGPGRPICRACAERSPNAGPRRASRRRSSARSRSTRRWRSTTRGSGSCASSWTRGRPGRAQPGVVERREPADAGGGRRPGAVGLPGGRLTAMAATRRPPAVARVLTQVTATVREHDLFTQGDHVLVWVSGGPDSRLPAESLVRLRRLFKLRLSVFHLDHGLRPGQRADAAYVRRLADATRAPTATSPDRVRRRPARESIEMWATVRRMAARPARSAVRIGATTTADGHTLERSGGVRPHRSSSVGPGPEAWPASSRADGDAAVVQPAARRDAGTRSKRSAVRCTCARGSIR